MKLYTKVSSVAVIAASSLVVQSKAYANNSNNLLPHFQRRTMAFGKHGITSCQAESSNVGEGKQTESNKAFKVQTWNPLRLAVLRLGLTEPMAVSSFNYGKYDGTFSCAYCGQSLFDSNAKYNSGSGWPSFWRSCNTDAISYKLESDGRLECRCKLCSSHLGHVFMDGPNPASVDQTLLESSPETDPRSSRNNSYLPRYCINGAAMKFDKRESK